MRKQSKWTLRVLAIATSGALLFTGPSALANSLNDLKGQQKELEQKKESINSNIKETEGKINQNESKIDQIMAQIQALE